jgi:deoxyribodipyrimidine photo-lyase
VGGCAFEPTRQAALARLDALEPEAYARTRNHVEGAATRLSPWITHGLLDVPEVIARLRERHALPADHALVRELGWREFFRHAWRHLGEGVLEDRRAPPWPGRYAESMPADLLQARTGVPAIDAAVRALYADGWLHNHARMWVASYAVHLRKVRWRVAADWMHARLLDGELASNHLSWQWIAGTFSTKPYVFDAANVARFGPASWRSPGTAIDRSYEALDRLARIGGDVGPEPAARPLEGVEPPALHPLPPDGAAPGVTRIDVATLAARLRDGPRDGAPLELVHPWALGGAGSLGGSQAGPQTGPQAGPQTGPQTGSGNAARGGIGLLHAPHHARFPWSAARWAFVTAAMARRVDAIVVGDAAQAIDAVVAAGRTPVLRACLAPGYREAIEAAARTGARVLPVPRVFDDPDPMCGSFSRFWRQVTGEDRARRP